MVFLKILLNLTITPLCLQLHDQSQLSKAEGEQTLFFVSVT